MLLDLFTGALGVNRTRDQEIRRLLLYPLSYEGLPKDLRQLLAYRDPSL